MTSQSWRRAWSVLGGVVAELIWLHPASAAVFRSVAAEDAAEEVVSVPRAA